MPADSSATEKLLGLAGQENRSALARLFDRHRPRLRRTVAARLDPRIAARVDPSDIVQETLTQAAGRLPGYLRARPVPFWVWLRSLAWQRLIWYRRFHLESRKRSVTRERSIEPFYADQSSLPMIDQLIASGSGPIDRVERDQECAWLRKAIEDFSTVDRQILELRYVDNVAFAEIAAKLDLGISAVKMRHLRALRRLRAARENRS